MNRLPALSNALMNLSCASGSVHLRKDNQLVLAAQIGLPSSVIPLIETIPLGKGMAGQAWLRREPVSTCNLQNDETAPIGPGARLVKAQSAVAVPVFALDDTVDAVIGFAFEDIFKHL